MKIYTGNQFDPKWLIELSTITYPGMPAIAKALSKCLKIVSPVNAIIDTETDFYIRFRDFGKHSFCMPMETADYTIILDLVYEINGMEVISIEKLNNFLLSQCNKVLTVES